MQFLLYNHGGSANHGCEAIARTTAALLDGEECLLYSDAVEEDIRYGLDQEIPLMPATSAYSKVSPSFVKAYAGLKIRGRYTAMDTLSYLKGIDNMPDDAVVLSIGGDIYCYEDYHKYIALHKRIAQKHKSVLLGCSINEELTKDEAFCADMHQYTYISARESLTYNILKSIGVEDVGLHPDTAFLLPAEELSLPDGFQKGNTVGINVSPLIVKREKKSGILRAAILELMKHILNETDCAIALIPHVVWEGNDDRTILKELYDEIACPERVVMIEDGNCMQLKGYISRCRFFIGARTHATIAAYSNGVPTLALGYSLKSRGIATDLFGTDENYVVPIEDVANEQYLVKSFKWLLDQEETVHLRLNQIIPDYKNRAAGAAVDAKKHLETRYHE